MNGLGVIILSLLSLNVVHAQGFRESLLVGDEAPEIEGVDQHGNEVGLSNLLEENIHAVVIFYRGSWCGYCEKHLSELQENLQQVLDANASVIVITPETNESIEKMISKTGATFSIIHDKDYSIMKAYHVDYVISTETVFKYYGPVVKRTATANGNDEGVLPIPATYIIDKEQIIKWVHLDPDYKERSSVADILEVIE